MKTVTEDDATLIIKALDHYADFLRATSRDDRPYREVITRIQHPERKAPAREEPLVVNPRRKKR